MRLSLIILIVLYISSVRYLQAQCPSSSQVEIAKEDFDSGQALGWELGSPAWRVDTARMGVYSNPGQQHWLYWFNGEGAVQEALSITSPSFQLASESGTLLIDFDLSFQEYNGQGSFQLFLEEASGNQSLIFEENADFAGRISLYLEGINSTHMQLKFVYKDPTGFGWGMGIDNLRIQQIVTICGNGICESGEAPAQCAEDCAPENVPNALWIPVGEDLAGNSVRYYYFKGKTYCDDCSQPIDLPFTLDHFGQSYETLFLNANGNLSLGASFLEYTPEPFCLKGPNLIAPFYGDVDILNGGEIQFYLDPEGHYAIFTWSEVAYFGCGRACPLRNSFQCILTDGSIKSIRGVPLTQGHTVLFVYGDMQWTTGSSSGGEAGLGGSAATVGLNHSDGQQCIDYGTFDHAGYDYYGNHQALQCAPNGVDHLDYRHLLVNASQGAFLDPEEAILFEGEAQGPVNRLRWKPGSTDRIEQFVLEHSEDGQAYQSLELIFSNDTTATGYYTFQDTVPYLGTTYYRLYFLRSDGEAYYSDPLAIENLWQPAPETFSVLGIGPNPFVDRLHIRYEATKAQVINCMLVDAQGRVLSEQEHQLAIGSHILSQSVGVLPKGIYYFHVRYQGGSTYRQLVHQ